MTIPHELGRAEDEGVDQDKQSGRAVEVRDAVFAEIGEERFIRSLMDCDYEMHTEHKDAVVEAAIERSGYLAARERLFGS